MEKLKTINVPLPMWQELSHMKVNKNVSSIVAVIQTLLDREDRERRRTNLENKKLKNLEIEDD